MKTCPHCLIRIDTKRSTDSENLINAEDDNNVEEEKEEEDPIMLSVLQ